MIDDEEQVQMDRGDATITNPDLIFVCVSLAEVDSTDKDRYFVLRKSELQAICSENYRQWMDRINWRRPRNYKSLDNRYYLDNLLPYENNWQLISKQLECKSAR